MAKRPNTIDDDLFASAPRARRQPENLPPERVSQERVHQETEQDEKPIERKKKSGRTETKPLTTHVSLDLNAQLDEIAEQEGWTSHSMRIYALSLFCDLYWQGEVPDAKKAIRRGKKTIRYSGGER